MEHNRKSITQLARELRNNPTPAEKRLWKYLRKRRLGGYRFVRQKPFVYKQRQTRRYFFIADFYCAQKKLVVELDGKMHHYQQYYDYQRDLVLEELGLTTLRIKNKALRDIAAVKQRILDGLES